MTIAFSCTLITSSNSDTVIFRQVALLTIITTIIGTLYNDKLAKY